jgi:GNAT superfamily N-acetyltransferase
MITDTIYTSTAMHRYQLLRTAARAHLHLQPMAGHVHVACVCTIKTPTSCVQEHAGRFTSSYIEQFARAEVQSLCERTHPIPPQRHPLCHCIAAHHANNDRIVATADLLPPAHHTDVPPGKVPQADAHGAFVLNLVVGKAWRKCGLGKQLTQFIAERARELGAQRLYAEVDSTNLVRAAARSECQH